MSDLPSWIAQLAGENGQTQSDRLDALQALSDADAGRVAVGLLEALADGADLGALVLMRCAKTLQERGDASLAPRVAALRLRLPLLPGLRDGRVDVDTAIASLDARAQGRCACEAVLDANTSPYDPRFALVAGVRLGGTRGRSRTK